MGFKSASNAALRRLALAGVPRVTPCVRRSIPHDPGASTQGLAYAYGQLFESTGGYGASSLRQLDPASGGVIRSVPVADDFAEGLALADGRIYQLTWQSGRVLIYDATSLARIAEARTGQEAWGLALIGDSFVISDGSSVLQIRDTALRITKRMVVRSNRLPVRHLNDLAFNGRTVLANVWRTAELVEISPLDGSVRTVIDCRSLVELERPRNEHAILNGIAHDSATDTYYLTGKYWRTMFEVTIPLTV